MPLDSLFFQIQMLLYVGSGLLLAGSVWGLVMKNSFLSQDWTSLFSPGDKTSDFREVESREKRRARRIQSTAVFELMSDSGSYIPESAHIHDISLKGVRFDSMVLLNEGRSVRGRLRSPHQDIHEITARIVWMKPEGRRTVYGIEFQDVLPVRP